MKPLVVALMILALAAPARAAGSQGISGHMVAAMGNARANPPPYPCARIFDVTGKTLLATATCSGTFGQFRVPLARGKYLVEFHGMTPHRQMIEVRNGHWTELGPKAPPAPMQ
jgi:hypothetical protein